MKRLCYVLLAAVAVVAGCGKSSPAPAGASAQNRKLTIALMPKSKGNAYFISCKMGAERAAKDLEWI